MGACEAVKNPNEKIIKSNIISEIKNQNNEKISSPKSEIKNNINNKELNQNDNQNSNINTNDNQIKNKNIEISPPNEELDLYPLRRRHRLRSENIIHPRMQFLSDKKLEEELDNNDNNNNTKKKQ